MTRLMVDLLPSSIAEDSSMLAAAQMLDAEFARIDLLIPLAAPWQCLDRLSEPVLSYLAAEVAVDVWESSWTEAKKRSVLKAALSVHRKKGTASAVVDGLEAMGFRARHVNWPEYGGDPYKFKVEVDVLDQGLALETYAQINLSIEENKAGRSHLDQLDVYLSGDGDIPAAVVAQTGTNLDVYPWIPDDQDVEASTTIGMGLAVYTIIDVEAQGAGA